MSIYYKKPNNPKKGDIWIDNETSSDTTWTIFDQLKFYKENASLYILGICLFIFVIWSYGITH